MQNAFVTCEIDREIRKDDHIVFCVRSAHGMLLREQKRYGHVDGTIGATDVVVRPDVFLLGENDKPADEGRVFQGLLLPGVRVVVGARGHQPDRSVPGTVPVTRIRRRAQHDRQPVEKVPVSASVADAQHVRRRSVNGRTHREIDPRLRIHAPEVSGPVLSVFHRQVCPSDDRLHRGRPVRRYSILVRGHQQVRSDKRYDQYIIQQ